MARTKLTAKQERFVAEYLVDLNATQAAIRAGYSKRNADKIGSELLGKTRVAESIKEAQSRREKRTEITQDKVLREIALIAFLDARKVMSWGPRGVTFLDSDSLSEDVARCVVEASQTVTPHGGTIRVKMADKLSALKLLGEHLGIFNTKSTGDTEDIATGLLRAAIRESVERRASQRRAAIESGRFGDGGLAAHLANPAPPETN